MSKAAGKRYPLGPYGLTIVLASLFLVSWILQTYAGWMDFRSEANQHHQVAQFFGSDGYVWHWLSQTMENWQSEFLQLLTFVSLTAYLVHVGSHESRDTDDEQKEQLDRIEKELQELKKHRMPAQPSPE